MISLRRSAASRRLARYAVAAVAARSADEGLAPGVALLAGAREADLRLAGLLVAAATAPQLLTGPLWGGLLDVVERRRVLVSGGLLLYAGALAMLAGSVGRSPAVALVAAAAAGIAGPLLAGGLSAIADDFASTRGSQVAAVDAAAYNVAAITGPLLVAAVAAGAGAASALLAGALCALMAAAVLADRRMNARPRPPDAMPPRRRPAVQDVAGAAREGAALLIRVPRLRAVTAATTVAYAGLGGLPLVAVALAEERGAPASGPLLVAIFAGGAVAGSLLAVRGGGAADRTVLRALLALGVAAALAAAAPLLVLAAAALAVAGAADGALLAGTFAVRDDHCGRHVRGTVYTTAASFKIAAGALGAAGAGLTVHAGGAAAGLAAVAGAHLAGAALLAMWRRTASAGRVGGLPPAMDDERPTPRAPA